MWLAFRNVRLREVWEFAQNISLGWILPFAGTALASHILRAERWRLLIEHDKSEPDRVTLIAGVLTGYLLNIVGPRLGEVTRPVYVARREGLSSSKLIGTIVLERIIDVSTMVLLMLVVSVYLIADLSLLSQIFGEETINLLTGGVGWYAAIWILLFLLLLAAGIWLLVRTARWAARHFEKVAVWVERVEYAVLMFKDGLLSARKVSRWGLFLVYTVLIWTCYTLMTYIPFWMFDMQNQFSLGMLEALTITVISAIGIAIPSPGGLGTYHYFVKQSLLVLFAVPAVTGLAYATITHAAMVGIVALFTPIALAIDKFRSRRSLIETNWQSPD